LMQNDRAKLRSYIEQQHITQAELARRAGVSQATVSRALGRANKKQSNAKARLFAYAGLVNEDSTDSTDVGIKLVMKAFEQIWDGSDGDARAVAKMIEALGGFRK
jgi:transcriptional regulator with XRE-family HTH domain